MNLEIREPLPSLEPGEALRRWRDELPLLAHDLPYLESLHETCRALRGDRFERHLVFTLDVDLPPLARPFLPKEALTLELAEDLDVETGSWSLHSRGVSKEAAAASGRLAFLPTKGGSELVAEGVVHLRLDALPRAPGFLLRSMEPTLERGVARGIEKGFARLARLLLTPTLG